MPPSLLDEGGERKYVTVLFADLSDSTHLIERLDAEEAMLRLDPAISTMTHAVSRFGGIVNRVQGDGIMALFGVPTAAENHAVRACLAARAIVDAAAADPAMQLRVGLASGDVVVRQTGSDAADYDVAGVTAHLAHRMQELAETGTVLATAETARLARGHADFTSVGPVAIKGLSAPLRLFRLLSVTERPSWDVRFTYNVLTRFRGREAEMAQLAKLAETAERGTGSAITIVAEAGMGKSRLAYEFVRTCGVGWRVLRASATQQSSGTPYHIAAALLRSLGANALSENTRGVDVPALRAILDADGINAGPDWIAVDPAARRRRMLDALTSAILRAASHQPIIVLLEDLQWVDPSSSLALDALATRSPGARLLLIATTRPQGRPAWAAPGRCILIELSALSETTASAMLDELLGHTRDLTRLRSRILARAEGTPLFLEEIVRSLREGSLTEDVEIPSSVRAILASRIDRLPSQRRRVLQVAAVLGRQFAPTLLAQVMVMPLPALNAELSKLDAAGLLQILHVPGHEEVTFCHALTHAEAYEGLLQSRRRELHAQVLEVLRTSHAGEADDTPEQLAIHALRAERWPDAAEYLLSAGRRANRRSAWREATGFLEHALTAVARTSQGAAAIALTIETWLQLRVAASALGDIRRMLVCLDQARALVPEGEDRLVTAQIDVRRCMGLSKLGEIHDAIKVGREALDAVHALGQPSARVTASFALGEALCYAAEYAEAEYVLRTDLELARGEALSGVAPGPGTPAVLYLSCLSRTLCMTGRFDAARAFAEEACAVADRLTRPFDQAEARQALGLLHLSCGAAAKAEVVLEDALALIRVNDSSLLLPIVAATLGPVRLAINRAVFARSLLEEAISQADRDGLAPFAAQCRVALAQVLMTEAPAQAFALCHGVAELARRLGLRPQEVQAVRTLAELHAAKGEVVQAASRYAEAIKLASPHGMRPEMAIARAGLAETSPCSRSGLPTSH